MDYQSDIAAVGRIEAVPTLLNVVCRVTGMRFAAVARVTEDRWICCAAKDDIAFGLKPGGELEIATTICDEIRTLKTPIAIDHVNEDDLWRDHHTPARYGFQSYVSMPIILKDGKLFGTLCAIDPRPAKVNNAETLEMFKMFAEVIAYHLDTVDEVTFAHAELIKAQKTSELREQFIAVLGHDLRNPLASIEAGTKLLLKTQLQDRAVPLIKMMGQSVARMSLLIDNLLDFARGRLGGGITVERAYAPIEPAMRQVIAELQSTHPAQLIEAEIELVRPVHADAMRLSQLLSNLLGNALTYGKADAPVKVRAMSDDSSFWLSVANVGEAIPPAAMERLFYPFSRGEVRPSQQGLGLGLYIASEIAKGHGGELTVDSTEQETRFTFTMPVC